MVDLVIGVVGPLASGKGEVVKLLEEKDFTSYSLSQTLRSLASLVSLPQTREALQDLGDLLRKHVGNGVLAERTADLIEKSNRSFAVVESIRHPDEIECLRKRFKTHVLAVDATLEKRFQLMQKRARLGDPETWEDFLKAANRDLEGGVSFGQQVKKCLEMADKTIVNDGDLATLQRKINDWMRSVDIEGGITGVEDKK